MLTIAWINSSTISEVSKMDKFCPHGRSTMRTNKEVIPGAVKSLLILKLVKAFMISNLIVLSSDVSLNPGPSIGCVDFGHETQGQSMATTTTSFGKLRT